MDRLLEKTKIKMVMRLRGVTRKEALKLLRESKVKPEDGEPAIKRTNVSRTEFNPFADDDGDDPLFACDKVL